MRTALCLALLAFSALLAQAPDKAKESTPTVANAAQPPSAPPSSITPKGFVLEDATPVRLRISRTVSSSDAHVGDTVDFEVLEDVLINKVLVVPKAGIAFATVTEAQSKRRMARGGKLDINIDYVRLVDDEKAALRAVKAVQGGGHAGAMTGGIVATSLVFFPAAPFFLFMHGKDISIPKGTEITAYVNGDMKLDIAKFQPQLPPAATSATPAATNAAPVAAAQAQLQISSTPVAADIEIDGSFVGSTPSSIGVAAGEHQLSVKKSGFKPWERKINVSTGQVNVNTVLEPDSK
jgi:hypothetical protein